MTDETDLYTPSLQAVAESAGDAERATRRLRWAVRDAHKAGEPIAHIAVAAGVTRPTIYEWIKETK